MVATPPAGEGHFMKWWQVLLIGSGSLVGMAVIGMVIILCWLYLNQDRLLYGGKREYEKRPDEYEMKYEDVHITTGDEIQLHGWLITQQKDSRQVPTLLFLLGQGGNAGLELLRCNDFYKRGYNMMLVSYRGSGGSDGKPTERGLVMDAQAALRYIVGRGDCINTGALFLFGLSMGGAVAVSLATTAEATGHLQGVIIENTFTSMNDLLNAICRRFRILSLVNRLRLLKRLNRSQWNSIETVTGLKVPVLFLSGLKDKIVPPIHMEKLFEATSSSRKQMKTFGSGGHADLWENGGVEYYDAVINFVKSSLA